MLVGHGSHMKYKMDAAIVALVRGEAKERIATDLGVGLTTLKRWCRDEDFRLQYEQAKKEANDEATQRCLALRHECFDLLDQWLHDTTHTLKFRKECADSILANTRGLAEGVDISVTYAQLTAQVERLSREAY